MLHPKVQECYSLIVQEKGIEIPRLPKTLEEIDLDGKLKETEAGERYLLCDDTDAESQRMLILSFATLTLKGCFFHLAEHLEEN